jgi:phosphoribosyl 1,2-cyclic phosphate phosphodiesterase
MPMTSNLTITMLGCGASGGVPLVGCECEVCRSPDARNLRSRASILVSDGTTTVLIDTSPDLRQQALRHGIRQVDAIFYTHDHADHTHGIDDIRSFNFYGGGAIPAYGNAETLDLLTQKFAYVFRPHVAEKGWFRPALIAHTIPDHGTLQIGTLTLHTFTQQHGRVTSLGVRIGDFAYSTDVNGFSETAFATLSGVRTWIVDCLRYEEAPTHAHLELTLSWIERIKPARAILTHMGHELEYHALKAQLPPSVEPAFDGMVISIC